jgi:hypothetical protein
MNKKLCFIGALEKQNKKKKKRKLSFYYFYTNNNNILVIFFITFCLNHYHYRFYRGLYTYIDIVLISLLMWLI